MIDSIRDAKDIAQLIGALLLLIPALAIFLKPIREKLSNFLGEIFTGNIEKKMIEKIHELSCEIKKLRSTQISQHRANVKGRKNMEKDIAEIKSVVHSNETLIEEHLSDKDLHN